MSSVAQWVTVTASEGNRCNQVSIRHGLGVASKQKLMGGIFQEHPSSLLWEAHGFDPSWCVERY